MALRRAPRVAVAVWGAWSVAGAGAAFEFPIQWLNRLVTFTQPSLQKTGPQTLGTTFFFFKAGKVQLTKSWKQRVFLYVFMVWRTAEWAISCQEKWWACESTIHVWRLYDVILFVFFDLIYSFETLGLEKSMCFFMCFFLFVFSNWLDICYFSMLMDFVSFLFLFIPFLGGRWFPQKLTIFLGNLIPNAPCMEYLPGHFPLFMWPFFIFHVGKHSIQYMDAMCSGNFPLCLDMPWDATPRNLIRKEAIVTNRRSRTKSRGISPIPAWK